MTDKLIECFEDTLSFVNKNEEIKKKTLIAKRNSRVYKENFKHLSTAFKYNVRSHLDVVRGTTFECAKKYAKSGRTAVLNFANPEYPGGSVKYGAMAQEECLCRSSNLYPCLTESKINGDFYGYHRSKDNGYYSDRIIYTRNVTVFKDEGTKDTVPHLMNVKDWFDVDVITCSAPYLYGVEDIDYAKLRDILKRRIKNIFEVALDNMAENIILGAFGCGVFGNPPGYNVYYGRQMAEYTGIESPKDTWWFKVVNFFRGKMLVNNSYSGSRVARLPKQERHFPAGCSRERTSTLHTSMAVPDVIIVYMGTNDWLFGVELDYYKKKRDFEDYTDFFIDAYDCMIANIKRNYPNAEIWCLTIPKNMAQRPESGFSMPRFIDIPLEEYNKVIRDCAKKYKARLIDMYSFDDLYDTIDCIHPNKVGMASLSEMVITCILQKC